MIKKINPLYVLSFVILWLTSFSKLFGTGIEFDGALYAALSRNKVLFHLGFWHTSLGLGNGEFTDHTPLLFEIEGLFFQIFGDSRAVEKIFTTLASYLVLVTLIFLWNELTNLKKIAWAPLFFLVGFSYFWVIAKNNWLEIPLIEFELLCVLFILKAYKANQIKFYVYTLLSYLAALCAFLIKGPLSLFLILAPLFIFLYLKEEEESWKIYKIQTFGFLKLKLSYAIFALGTFATAVSFYLDKDARTFLSTYIRTNVEPFFNAFAPHTFKARHDDVSPHFWVLWDLAQQLSLPILIFLVLFYFFKFKKTFEFIHLKSWTSNKFLALLGLALISSLPFLLFRTNYNRYITPSFPFYSLAFIYLFRENLIEITNQLTEKFKVWTWSITVIIFVIGTIQAIYFYPRI
jgi:hypothetical protein